MSPPAAVVAVLPQYDIGEILGEGAMGVVYAATHRALGRNVAVKQLPAAMAADPRMSKRFDSEARLLAGLDHPHIVPVYDYVRADSVNVLVMERLDGGTVWDRFHQAGLTVEQSCAITLAMLGGLHAAHRSGVLHLDVKPKNLLFTSGGALKVADFGIAQVISEGATLVTSSGEVLGTPAYLSPEQALGTRLTPAADVYAAGTVLYELVSGSLPYERDGDALAMVRRHVYEDPRPIGRQVPPPLAAVIMRSLARDPLQRYPDAETCAVALASAASVVFGPGWLERAGVPVQLAPKVVTAAATARAVVDDTRTVRLPLVRPQALVATRSLGLDDVGTASLVPAQDVLGRAAPPRHPAPPPRPAASPLWPLLTGLVSAAVLVFLALAGPVAGGVAAPDPSPPGLTIDDVPATGTIPMGFTDQIALAGKDPPAGPLTARFRLSIAGVPLGTGLSEPVTSNQGTWQARVAPPPYARWVAGGAVIGQVDLLRNNGEPARTYEFGVAPERSPLLSVMGAGCVLLLLFAVMYLEAVVRALRHGKRRVGGPIMALPLGALFGGALWLLASMLGRQLPTDSIGMACALLGSFAAVTVAVAARRVGQARQ